MIFSSDQMGWVLFTGVMVIVGVLFYLVKKDE
ncbi:MAG: hypothetical protein G01um101416_729 [Microgenomates group bacterium Gr01-1014_16]|nr:MAG: hypothetical protein G01um101416_729 [Microgenomates group bacterium Gr01-1014_16]